MAERSWWQGDRATFNGDAMDFIIAAEGLLKAYRRLKREEEPDVHTVIECAGWIASAVEACKRDTEPSVLGAFYWVRNKGFHETTTAIAQMLPSTPTARYDSALFDVSAFDDEEGEPARWLPIPESDEATEGVTRATRYNEFLAGRPIIQTVAEAHRALLVIFEEMRRDSGVQTLT